MGGRGKRPKVTCKPFKKSQDQNLIIFIIHRCTAHQLKEYFLLLVSIFRGGMKEFRERVRLPCDDRKIRSSHEEHLLEALTFFESETEDTAVTARWLYMEELGVN